MFRRVSSLAYVWVVGMLCFVPNQRAKVCYASFSSILVFLWTAANGKLASDRVSEPGKSFYAVFFKEGANTSSTIDFLKSIVNNDDLCPRPNTDEQLVALTVEASPSKAIQLQNLDGIHRVVKLEIPARYTTKPEQKAPPGKRRKCVIYPVDGNNMDQCDATSEALKALLDGKIRELERGGPFRRWAAKLTFGQLGQVKDVEGVDLVQVRPIVEGHRKEPEDPTAAYKYVIYPANDNPEHFDETGVALKAVLGDKLHERGGMVPRWVADLTSEEAEQTRRIDGVSAVKRPHKGYRG